MDEGSRQPRNCVQEAVLGINSCVVRLDGTGTGINDDFAFGAELMPIHRNRTSPMSETPGVARKTCSVRSTSPGQRDEEPENRIGPIPPGCDTPNPEQDSD